MRISVPIQIDRDIIIPMHQQLSRQIREAISGGIIKSGDHLPSVRQWATKLNVSVATISSAYSSLAEGGWIVSQPRSGYRVAGHASAQVAKDSDPTGIPILHMDKVTPYMPLHPVAEFGKLIAEVSSGDSGAGGYEEYRGNPALIGEFLRLAQGKGIRADERNIMITNGTQQAINLVGQLLNRGDRVLVEEPAYPGALRVFEHYGAELLPVPMLVDGPDLQRVHHHLQRGHVRLMYTCPNYQNPTGHSYSVDKRRALALMAQEEDFRIFEDDYLGDLDYLGESFPPIKAFDTGGRVIYACTLSKCLLPSLRVAYVAADGDLITRLVKQKTMTAVCGSAYLERALAVYLGRDMYGAHLARIRPHYRGMKELFDHSVSTMGDRISSILPKAGMTAFFSLPTNMDAIQFSLECRAEGLLISPGTGFHSEFHRGHSEFRLAFGGMGEEGMALFPETMRKVLDRLDASQGTAVL